MKDSVIDMSSLFPNKKRKHKNKHLITTIKQYKTTTLHCPVPISFESFINGIKILQRLISNEINELHKEFIRGYKRILYIQFHQDHIYKKVVNNMELCHQLVSLFSTIDAL